MPGAFGRRQRALEDRRAIGGKICERVERERAEAIERLILRVPSLVEKSTDLDTVLAFIEQQRCFVGGLKDRVIAPRQQRGAAAKLQCAQALRAIGQIAQHLHATERQRDKRRPDAIVDLQAGAQLVHHRRAKARR